MATPKAQAHPAYLGMPVPPASPGTPATLLPPGTPATLAPPTPNALVPSGTPGAFPWGLVPPATPGAPVSPASLAATLLPPGAFPGAAPPAALAVTLLPHIAAVRALQQAVHRCAPEVRGTLSVFLLCDASSASAVRGALAAKDRQGLIVVLRPGESPPVSREGELLIIANNANPLAAPCGHFSGDLARAVLRAGDEATIRQMLPEVVARVFLTPSQDERAAFAKELARFVGSKSAEELLHFVATQDVAASRPLREKLRAWLMYNYGSTARGLKAFDVDASGSISAQEISRAAKQAGFFCSRCHATRTRSWPCTWHIIGCRRSLRPP